MRVKKQVNTHKLLHTYIHKAEGKRKYTKQWHRICDRDIEDAVMDNLD